MMAFCKKIFARLLIGLTLALSAQETVNATDTGKRIVILGDSITAGYGLGKDAAYPALLEGKLKEANLAYTVTNAGVSGDTTAGGLRRVTWALAKGADILVIALGGNDGLRGIPPAETRKNLLGIVEKARSKNPEIKIFIAGMQMPDNMGPEFTAQYKNLFPEVSKEAKTTLIPFLLEGVGGIEGLNQADGIHPNAKGQRIVAENVWASLKNIVIE